MQVTAVRARSGTRACLDAPAHDAPPSRRCVGTTRLSRRRRSGRRSRFHRVLTCRPPSRPRESARGCAVVRDQYRSRGDHHPTMVSAIRGNDARPPRGRCSDGGRVFTGVDAEWCDRGQRRPRLLPSPRRRVVVGSPSYRGSRPSVRRSSAISNPRSSSLGLRARTHPPRRWGPTAGTALRPRAPLCTRRVSW